MNHISTSHSFLRTINKGFLALLIFIVSSLPASAMNTKRALMTSNEVGAATVLCHPDGFHVYKKGKLKKIQRPFVSKELRKLNNEQLSQALSSGQAYLKLNQNSDGEYALDFKTRINGGGYWGAMAGAYTGKFVTSFVGHGALLVVSFAAGPLQPAAFYALEGTFGPTIEGASLVVALAGGIAGGAATGPV